MKIIGDHVIYVDPKGVEYNALVQHIWSETCINLVHLSDNIAEEDNYGRQIKHATSVQHQTIMAGVPGFYWKG